VSTADIDGDGDIDIIGDQCWWENLNADGTEWSKHLINTGQSDNRLSTADIDGDGDMDIGAWF